MGMIEVKKSVMEDYEQPTFEMPIFENRSKISSLSKLI